MPLTPKWNSERSAAARKRHEAEKVERRAIEASRRAQREEIERLQTDLYTKMGRQLGLESGAILFACTRGKK